jgi:hypothetical protein
MGGEHLARSWDTRFRTKTERDRVDASWAWQKWYARRRLLRLRCCRQAEPCLGQTISQHKAVLPVPGPPTTIVPHVLDTGRCSRECASFRNAHSRQKNRLPSSREAAITTTAHYGTLQIIAHSNHHRLIIGHISPVVWHMSTFAKHVWRVLLLYHIHVTYSQVEATFLYYLRTILSTVLSSAAGSDTSSPSILDACVMSYIHYQNPVKTRVLNKQQLIISILCWAGKYLLQFSPEYCTMSGLTARMKEPQTQPLLGNGCVNKQQFFCNLILFAICTRTFWKLCKTYTMTCRRVLNSTPL